MKRFLVNLIALAALTSPAIAEPAATAAPDSKPAAEASAAPASKPILSGVKSWFGPKSPVEIKLAAEGPVSLYLTEFTGAKIEAKGSTDVEATSTTDLRKLYGALDTPGCYLLYAVPKGKDAKDFVGTPLVVEVRADRRGPGQAEPVVVKVEPLRFINMTTSKGDITLTFYYDVAPNTTTNFLTLASGGFYNGLLFHRIVPSFVIQGGDPRGDGMGGPGYQIDAEFNERPHLEGVLSMARSQDVNSAGSQFFICLDYSRTKQLDRHYTAFGRAVTGLDIVKAIAAVATNPETDRPLDPPSITKMEVKKVTASDNPYVALQKELQAK